MTRPTTTKDDAEGDSTVIYEVDDAESCIPFMDTFWKLASEDAGERSFAAKALIVHCFPTLLRCNDPTASPVSVTSSSEEFNVKDSSYALRRLLDGLSSGRACARQGFAACLSSFLTVCFERDNDVQTSNFVPLFLQVIKEFEREKTELSASENGKKSIGSFCEFVETVETGQNKINELVTALHWLRNELLERTDPRVSSTTAESDNYSERSSAFSGKRKKSKTKGGGSEERDFAFGRLFGIMAVSKSGVLNSAMVRICADGADEDKRRLQRVLSGFAYDIVELIKWRKWIREVSCQALIEMVEGLFDCLQDSACSKKDQTELSCLCTNLICEVFGPTFFENWLEDANEEDHDSHSAKKKGWRIPFASLTPEQLAAGLFVQRKVREHTKEEETDKFRSGILAVPFLTTETLPYLADCLISTAHAYPRRHIVWSQIMKTLLETDKSVSEGSLTVTPTRNIRPLSDSSANALKQIFENIVERSMMNTHERKALALKLMHDFSLVLPSKDLHLVLRPQMIHLLLNTLSRSDEKNNGSKKHTLHPLGEQILRSIVNTSLHNGSASGSDADRDASESSKNENHKIRFVVAKALLDVDPRFDARTSTNSVNSLIHPPSSGTNFGVWSLQQIHEYFDFLEEKILNILLNISSKDVDDDAGGDYLETEEEGRKTSAEEVNSSELARISFHKIEGYLDLMYNFVTKQIADLDAKERDELTDRVQVFLMMCAFFDCGKLSCSPTEADAGNKNRKKHKKRKRKSDSKNTASLHPVVAAVLRIQRRGGLCSPYPLHVRAAASARFFSLLATSLCSKQDRLSGTVIPCGLRDSQTSSATKVFRNLPCSLKLLMNVATVWNSLEEHGAKLIRTEFDEQCVECRKMANSACEFALMAFSNAEAPCEHKGNSRDGKIDEKVENSPKHEGMVPPVQIFISGCVKLILSLYLQMLRCGVAGTEEHANITGLVNDDEDDVDDEVTDLISDLFGVLQNVVNGDNSNDEEGAPENVEEKPLNIIADVCCSALSLRIDGKNRGGTARLLRDTVKSVWQGALTLASWSSNQDDKGRSSPDHERSGMQEFVIGEDVIRAVLESVCGAGAFEDPNDESEGVGCEIDENENDDENESYQGDASSAEDDADGRIFSSTDAMKVALGDVDGDSEVSLHEEEDTKNMVNYRIGCSGKQDEDEDDVELDSSQLRSLLLEEDGTEGDEGDGDEDEDGQVDSILGALEHHAGADAALARMIQLKQESRKAALNERDRTSITHRLRCVSLLDVLFSHRHLAALSTDLLLSSILPLLRSRRVLERSISSVSSEGRRVTKVGLGEKRSLLDRITAVLKNKICKARARSDDKWKVATSDLVHLAESIMLEARRSPSEMHCGCCSASLALLLKCAPDGDTKMAVAKVYQDAVDEWSTRRKTKLHLILFDDLTKRFPRCAIETLVGRISIAAKRGRSAFIKSESFRLLSDMYSVDTEDVREVLSSALVPSAEAVFSALESGDTAVTKAKRVRHLLLATEALIAFKSTNSADDDFRAVLDRICPLLGALGQECRSDSLKKTCATIVSRISAGLDGPNKWEGECEASPKSSNGIVPTESAGSRNGKQGKNREGRRVKGRGKIEVVSALNAK